MPDALRFAEPYRIFDFGEPERRYSRRPFLVFAADTNDRPGDVPEVRVVRLAWGLYDARGRARAFHDAIVTPDGFEISAVATRIHGLSTARARREGRPLADVVAPFVAALLDARAVVSHDLFGHGWSAVLDEIGRAGLLGVAYGADVDAEDTARIMRTFYPCADQSLPGAHRYVLGRAMSARRRSVHNAADNARACAALFVALRSRRRYRRIRARTGGAARPASRQVEPPAEPAFE